MEKKEGIHWGKIVLIIIVLFLVASIASCTISSFIEVEPLGNVAVIPIKGIIITEGSLGFGQEATTSTETIRLIEKAEKNPRVKAVLFEINSGGGSAVASKEIADAVLRMKKPTYSLIREIGASGAYWVASATGKIIASELSITGSIGVIASYIEFAGLLERYNMTYQRLVAGDYKDIGSPYKRLAQDERGILQQKINKIHDYFIKAVAKNRNISVEKIREIATGSFSLGIEAKEQGLVDIIGDRETAAELIKSEQNLTEVKFAEYKKPKTIMDMLAGLLAEPFYNIGRGIGFEITNPKTENKINILT